MASTNGAFWTQTFLKADGTPYVGVRVFHYVAGGTTTNLDVYQNGNLTAPHNNPVVGDASGRVSFYGNGTYRLEVRTSTNDGNLILYDWDPVELVHHTATVRAEDRGISLPSASSAARGRLFGVTDGGGDVTGLWLQRTAAAWQQILTLPTLSQMIQFAKGTTIASTTSVTIPDDGNVFDITGTNSIETFSGFTGYPVIYTRFTGTGLTLVHNGTTFLLPGSANYTTIQNEVITWLHLGAGTWTMLRSNKGGVSGALTDGYGIIADSTTRWTEKNIMPIGSALMWTGTVVPAHWLLCNGQAVSRSTYSRLFSTIGVTFGVGNGSTTFNIPDWQGRVPVGVDTTAGRITSSSVGGLNVSILGGTGGAQTHTLTLSELPSHSHTASSSDDVGGASGLRYPNAFTGIQTRLINNDTGTRSLSSDGGDQPHSNTQPWLAVHFIIYAGA